MTKPSPSASSSSVSIATAVGMVLSNTWSLMLAVLLPRLVVTETVVTPSAFRVSLPFLSMVAALVLLDFQVSALEAVSGSMTAFSL